jgi:hypothetical protein
MPGAITAMTGDMRFSDRLSSARNLAANNTCWQGFGRTCNPDAALAKSGTFLSLPRPFDLAPATRSHYITNGE